MSTLQEEIHFRVLRLLEENPQMTQRELSAALEISLGKVNYCLRALLDKGLIKIQNFKNNKNKLVYMYLLTPNGVFEKAVMAKLFLKRKVREYEILEREIKNLKNEVKKK